MTTRMTDETFTQFADAILCDVGLGASLSREFLTEARRARNAEVGLTTDATSWRAVIATETEDIGERLGRIGRATWSCRDDDWLHVSEETRCDWRKAAIAVRRAVIAGMVTEKALESAWSAFHDHTDLELSEMTSHKTGTPVLRAAILAAAGEPAVDGEPIATKTVYEPVIEELREQRKALQARITTLEGLNRALGENAVASANEAEKQAVKARVYGAIAAEYGKALTSIVASTDDPRVTPMDAPAVRQALKRAEERATALWPRKCEGRAVRLSARGER